MPTFKEMQKRVRENFKNILETHAAAGLPVVVSENDKIFHLYKDGKKVEILVNRKPTTELKKKISSHN